MKKIYTTLFLLSIAVISVSQPYFVYTAQNSGNWTDAGNWNIQPRTDGISKNKIVVPASFTIIADNSVNSMGLGDIEVIVSGTLDMAHNTSLNLSSNSSIQLNNGSIDGNAGNQQILIGGIMKYRGNLDGIKTGLSIADNTTGVSPNGFQSLSLLPVNFTSFYVSKTDQSIQLTWSTDKEINNSHFDVERSFNGIQWEKISIIFSAGTISKTNNYTYNDKDISSPVVYYRLRQVDLDGRSVFSSIKMIRMSETISPVKVYGFEKNVVVDLNSSVKGRITVSVITTNGQVISRQSYNNPSYKINLNISNIAPGAYIVQVTANTGWSEVKKVIL